MSTKTKRAGIRLRIVLFVAVLVVICAAALFLRSSLRSEPNPEPDPVADEPVTSVQTTPSLPENSYDLSAFSLVDGRMTYSGTQPVTTGVDVSMHQGVIDWQAVADAGVDFAIIRVGNRGTSDGGLSLDEYYLDNMRGALDAGLKVGVYFFSQAISVEEAREEARFVLSWLRGFDLALPVFYDWENVAWEARTDGMDSITLTACAEAFCSTIAGAGYRAGLYFNQTFGYQQFDLPELQEYTFWLASYSDVPDFKYHFDLWQYTASGSVPGIGTVVDLNLCFSTFIEEE